LSKTSQPETRRSRQKELEEQAYRLKLFLEIISEADLLLLKKLVKQKREATPEEPKR